ncbi:MAG: ribosome biogenesis GTP-binding protein YihA/YsxC [Bacteroidota bacterium]
MIIRSVKFVKSSAKFSQMPVHDMPEYAFIGRSNVGKSSLINMLTGYGKLAKTSTRPGKTQLVNHFYINESWYLADLPGYGYAKASKSLVADWNKLIIDFIKCRKQLCCLFLLVDIRHAPLAIDLDFMKMLGKGGIPFAIVFTKVDKISSTVLEKNMQIYKNTLLQEWEELPEMFISSSPKKSGRDEILTFIENINNSFKTG